MEIIDSKVLWLTPDEISTVSQPRDHKEMLRLRKQRVVGGDWDTPHVGRTWIDLFREAWVAYLRGTPIESSQYYREFAACNAAHIPHGWNANKAIWAAMYEDIKANGYSVKPYPQNVVDEYVTIDIGRNGQIFFHNGTHRLVFCQLLGVEKMPVKVMLRHTLWQELRSRIEAYAAQPGHRGNIYTPLNHPDLQEYNSWWDNWRPDVIGKHISPASKSVLDVGAHWGNVSFALHTDTRHCTALESYPENQWFLSRFKAMYRKDVRIVHEDLFSFLGREYTFDTVLFLNILHHYVKTESGYKKLCDMLARLKTKEIFFMCEDPKAIQMADAYWNPEQEEFTAFVAKLTHLHGITCLGEQGRRKLYKLSA